MRIKSEFKIKDQTWITVQKWNLTYNKKKVDGICDSKNCTIFLDRALSKEDKEIAWRHEYRHAVWEVYGCGLWSGKVDEDVMEEMNVALDIEEAKTFNWRVKK